MSGFLNFTILIISGFTLIIALKPNGLYSYLLWALLTVCFAKVILVLLKKFKKSIVKG